MNAARNYCWPLVTGLSWLLVWAHATAGTEPTTRATPGANEVAAPTAAANPAMQRKPASAAPSAPTSSTRRTKSTPRSSPAQAKPAKARLAQRGAREAQQLSLQAVQRSAARATESRAREREDQIRELLLRARRQAADGKLIEPLGNNAASLYRDVLVLEPTHAEALAAASRIATVLADEVARAALAGNQVRAEQYLAQLSALQPQDDALQGLRARVQALQASPVVMSSRQQDRYALSAQMIDRANGYLNNQPLNLRTLDQAIDEYDRAAALIADAPGLPLLKDRIVVLFPQATRAELADERSRRALKLVQTARARGWASPELEPLEAAAKATLPPGNYDVTLAECPDSVAQACAQRRGR